MTSSGEICCLGYIIFNSFLEEIMHNATNKPALTKNLYYSLKHSLNHQLTLKEGLEQVRDPILLGA